ncbi:MAG: DUF6531 domain-containing protein, partial [Chloroflexi bacterium]|nr:DUF6531 domain-containing protein [Chloroflexota bacterium]
MVNLDNIALVEPVPPEPILPLLPRMVWSDQSQCPVCYVRDAVGWAGGPVNTRTGNLSYHETDLFIPVKGGALAFYRSYASGAVDFYTTTLGYGWTHNFDMRLHFTHNALTDTIELQASGGSRLPFFIERDGAGDITGYTPYPGVTASLGRITVTNPITTHYIVTGFNQMTYTFDYSGKLLQQADPFSNVITFTYNITGQLVRAAQDNRYLEYNYDANGRLVEVNDNIGRQVLLDYDGYGDLVAVTNTLEVATTYEYSITQSTSTHLLTMITDPSGRVVEETAYDAEGRAVQQWDGLGNLLVDIDYGIANSSNLTENVVIENGVIMTHTYDEWGTVIDMTFACIDGTPGCQAGLDKTYDFNFKANHIVDANNNSTVLEWDPGGSNVEQVTDGLDQNTFLDYDGLNNLIQVVNARDFATTYGYHDPTLPTFLTVITDALGNTTFFTATDGGLLQEQRDANGNLTTYDYNAFGQVTQVVRAAGTPEAITTTYGYDGAGRLITTTQSSAEESHTSLNVYDDGDRLIATVTNWTGNNPNNWQTDCANGTSESNVCTRYGYDAAGRTISTTNALDQTSLTFYDAAGRVVTSVTNYDGVTPFGQLCASFANPDPEYNICSLTGYDAAGRVVTTTGSLGRQTLTRYDALGRVAGSIANSVYVTDLEDCNFPPDNPDEDLCTLYQYDAAGNIEVVTDPVGRLTRTFYDELNRVKATIANWQGNNSSLIIAFDLDQCFALPAERDYDICTLYQYDEVGNTTLVIDTLGRMTRTFYDPLNRVQTTVANWNPATLDGPEDCVIEPGNDSVANICTLYGYDEAGNQITVTNALSQTSLTVYDSANRPVIQVTNWDGQTEIDEVEDCVLNDPDAVENLCTITTYDHLGRRVSVTDPMDNVTEFAYDGLGRVVTTTRTLDGQPVRIVTEYDALGRRLSQTDPLTHTTVFTYDSLNRLVTTTSPEGVAFTQQYNAASWVLTTTDSLNHSATNSYDDLGRLVATTDAENNTTQYVYDALGNQVAMIDAEGITTTYQYDDLNRLVRVIENDVPGANPTDDQDVVTGYGYDALGNRVSVVNAREITFTLTAYDGLNRPVVMTDALEVESHYAYDALGNRTVMTDGNNTVTLYTYDALNRLTLVEYLDDTETVS